MRQWADVFLDRIGLQRPVLCPVNDRSAPCFRGTIVVEPHWCGRAGVRDVGRERVKHMPGSGGHAVGDHSRDGVDEGPVDPDLLNPTPQSNASAEDLQTREFSDLVRTMAAELHRFASSRLGPNVAEDVVSDVFVVVWRRWEVMPADRDGRRAWVFEVTKRTILDASAREARRRRLLVRVARVDERALEQPGDALVAREAVDALLEVLPEGQREALRLTAIDGLSAREAAQSLGVSATAITTRLHRARRALQAWLAEGPEEVEP